MITNKLSLSQRIIMYLEGFNKRVKVRRERNQELLIKMRVEENFTKSMKCLRAMIYAGDLQQDDSLVILKVNNTVGKDDDNA